MPNNIVDLKLGILLQLGAIIGFFAPIQELLIFTTVFVIFDYTVGVIAATNARSRKKIKPIREVFKDTSIRYFYILVFSLIIVSLSWILGTHVIPIGVLQLERTTASTICVFSLVNIIKNSAYITKSKAFSSINRYVKVKFQ